MQLPSFDLTRLKYALNFVILLHTHKSVNWEMPLYQASLCSKFLFELSFSLNLQSAFCVPISWILLLIPMFLFLSFWHQNSRRGSLMLLSFIISRPVYLTPLHFCHLTFDLFTGRYSIFLKFCIFVGFLWF